MVRSMMQVYVKNSFEAVKFYRKVFDAQKIDYPLGSVSFRPHMASVVDKYGIYWCIFTDGQQ